MIKRRSGGAGPVIAVGVALAVLAGCGGVPGFGGKKAGSETYVGWYCVDNPDTGIKDCEKRLMRNGAPVNDHVYERLGAAAPQSVEANTGQSPLTVINPLDDGGGLSVENQGPPPREVRSYVDRSGENKE